MSADRSRVEIIVVDNASEDGSSEMVLREFSEVRLLQNTENLGFAAANNQAVETASGRYLLLLNSDTELQAGALTEMLDALESNPSLGIAGARLLNSDGSLQESCTRAPTPLRDAMHLAHLDGLGAGLYYRMNDWTEAAPKDVDCVMGAALMLSRETWDQAGGLDEGYFMYSEEVELCERVRQAGKRISWLPSARVIHHGGASSERVADEMFVMLYSSKLRFYRRNRAAWQATLMKLVLLVASLPRFVLGSLMAPLGTLTGTTERWSRLRRQYGRLLRELPTLGLTLLCLISLLGLSACRRVTPRPSATPAQTSAEMTQAAAASGFSRGVVRDSPREGEDSGEDGPGSGSGSDSAENGNSDAGSEPTRVPPPSPVPMRNEEFATEVAGRSQELEDELPESPRSVGDIIELEPLRCGALSLNNRDRRGDCASEVLRSGVLDGREFLGLLAFDLRSLPAGSRLIYAELELTGLDTAFAGENSAWTLRSIDLPESELIYDLSFARAMSVPILQSGPAWRIEADSVADGESMSLTIPPEARPELNEMLGKRTLVFRLEFSFAEDDGKGLISWHSRGDSAPVLRLALQSSTPSPATPSDIIPVESTPLSPSSDASSDDPNPADATEDLEEDTGDESQSGEPRGEESLEPRPVETDEPSGPEPGSESRQTSQPSETPTLTPEARGPSLSMQKRIAGVCRPHPYRRGALL